MTDYTAKFTAQREEDLIAESAGMQEAEAMHQEEEIAAGEKMKAAEVVAYDGANLGAVGPSEEEYDYEGAYAEGNTFKEDEGGGITLKNKNLRVGKSYVAGRDINTGEQIAGSWQDVDGDIEKGRQILSDGEWNTQNGSSYPQTDGLFSVANGILKEGGTFEDYQEAIQGPWNHDQIAMGWNAADTAHRTMTDIDGQGRRHYDVMREEYDKYEGIVNAIPAQGYTEETLAADPSWVAGGRKMAEFLFGEGSTADSTDEQIGESTKFFVSQMRNNFDMTMFWADRIIQENDPDLARAWLALDEQYDALEMSGPVVGRAAMAQFNITNLLTFGGGMLITNLGKEATKMGVRESMKRVIGVSVAEAGITGGMGAAEDLGRQNVEIVAGQREEVDLKQTAAVGGVNALVGFGVGFGLNSLASPTIRSYAGDKSTQGMKFVKDNMNNPIGMGPMPGGPAAQRGSVGIPVTGDAQVTASFKLQDAFTGLKDGSKPITVRENIRAMVNNGQITEQEVKWSGVEDFVAKKETAGEKVSRQELIDYVERTTPKPKLVDVNSTQYSDYSLLTAESALLDLGEDFGYNERMLVIPGGAQGAKIMNHFPEEQIQLLGPDDTMIGHSRTEGAMLATVEGQKTPSGKMVLEIQSDYHKEGQQSGYIAGDEFKGNTPIVSNPDNPRGEEFIDFQHKPQVYEAMIKLANENNIDPYAKNSVSQLWPHMDANMKEHAAQNKPEYKPFGKDWDALGMRLEIMDSINRGDEFVAWPSTAEQISIIEEWGSMYDNPGIVKRATTDRNKAMKKMGLEVEEVDLPQYKGSLVRDMFESQADADQIVQSPEIRQGLTDQIERTGITFKHTTTAGKESDMTTEDSISMLNFEYQGLDGGLDDLLKVDEAGTFTVLDRQGDVLHNFNGIDEIHDYMWEVYEKAGKAAREGKNPSTVFNVIKLTPEIKAKFRAEGMNMYGAAPVAGAAVAAAEKGAPLDPYQPYSDADRAQNKKRAEQLKTPLDTSQYSMEEITEREDLMNKLANDVGREKAGVKEKEFTQKMFDRERKQFEVMSLDQLRDWDKTLRPPARKRDKNGRFIK